MGVWSRTSKENRGNLRKPVVGRSTGHLNEITGGVRSIKDLYRLEERTANAYNTTADPQTTAAKSQT